MSIRKPPIIDFGSWRKGSLSGRRTVTTQLDLALRKHGCFYLDNHGVERSELDTCFKLSRELFTHPAKKDLPRTSIESTSGYSTNEKVRGARTEKENFDFDNAVYEPDPDRWPLQEILPNSRPILKEFYQDGTSGLEVSDRSEGSMTNKSIEQLTFSPVDPNPNLIFVNTGYLLERWTDGQWKGVRHRVCESIKRPEGDTESESCVKPWERYSIAFFAAFDPDTIIQSQGKAVLNVGNYLTQKRALMYSE
ncbi:hypothetical protein KCV03_g9345, partial [Aureobasidium melanogenum]